MPTVHQSLIEQARARYGSISSCNGLPLDDGFTVMGSKLLFWFNDSRGSTHVVQTEYPHECQYDIAA